MRSSAITKSHITVAMSDDLKESGAHFKSFSTSPLRTAASNVLIFFQI